MTGLEWLGVVAAVVGMMTPFALYFKGRMNKLQDNHLAHIQASLDRVEGGVKEVSKEVKEVSKEMNDFIKEHLTGHK